MLGSSVGVGNIEDHQYEEVASAVLTPEMTLEPLPAALPAPALDDALARRLALVAGAPPDEARKHLESLAQDATEAPAFEAMATLCRTLSDRNRLAIAAMLKRQSPLSGCEIQVALGLAQATVSHHMKALVESGIVDAERAGKWTYYSLDARFERLVP